ncbi:MAG: hypothetical protein P8181_04820 [bacterium]
MKLAIAGAGLTGAYLYRLLTNRGWKPDLYDIKIDNNCGLRGCAWGTSGDFKTLLPAAGLNPDDYILNVLDYVYMDDIRIPAELMTIDKPSLIRDLLHDAEIRRSSLERGKYDRIIDATGVARAYLPKIDDDILLPCIQYYIRTQNHLDKSLLSDPRKLFNRLGWIKYGAGQPDNGEILCGCAGDIRLTAPHYSLPYTTASGTTEIWGTGEAIGCVAPLAGDGIVPGMRSVRLLLEHWDNRRKYTKAILKEFSWMKQERAIIDKLRFRRPLRIWDAMILTQNAKRMKMKVSMKHAAALLQNLRPDVE